MSVQQDTFRITFYFSGKSESSVLSANLPESVRKAFTETRGKTFRSISLRMQEPEDVMLACQLCDLKIQTGWYHGAQRQLEGMIVKNLSEPP